MKSAIVIFNFQIFRFPNISLERKFYFSRATFWILSLFVLYECARPLRGGSHPSSLSHRSWMRLVNFERNEGKSITTYIAQRGGRKWRLNCCHPLSRFLMFSFLSVYEMQENYSNFQNNRKCQFLRCISKHSWKIVILSCLILK